jgi:hypothetical protein
LTVQEVASQVCGLSFIVCGLWFGVCGWLFGVYGLLFGVGDLVAFEHFKPLQKLQKVEKTLVRRKSHYK